MGLEVNLDYYLNTCVPEIGTKTISAIVQVESGKNPWVIYDNTNKVSYKFTTKAEAVSKAEELIDKGNSLDLGLAQINSKNLSSLNLKVKDMFEPCNNLKAGATILKNFYTQAKLSFSDEQVALYHALSAYNTGSFYKGHQYANKVWRMATGGNIIQYNISSVKVKSAYNAPIIVNWY